jgi:hypothetical protein
MCPSRREPDVPDGDRDRDPRNPLAPYYPAEVPDVPGEGRTWFALLVTATLLAGALAAVGTAVLALLG